MTKYRRIRLGKGARYRDLCLEEGFVGLDYGLDVDLTGRFSPQLSDFSAEFAPVIMAKDPERTKVAAGIGCSAIWGLA